MNKFKKEIIECIKLINNYNQEEDIDITEVSYNEKDDSFVIIINNVYKIKFNYSFVIKLIRLQREDELVIKGVNNKLNGIDEEERILLKFIDLLSYAVLEENEYSYDEEFDEYIDNYSGSKDEFISIIYIPKDKTLILSI